MKTKAPPQPDEPDFEVLFNDVTSVNQQFMQILKQSFAAKHANLTSPAIPAPYAIEVIFSSTISIFSLWIKREMRESIPELLEIVRKYSELSPKEIITI